MEGSLWKVDQVRAPASAFDQAPWKAWQRIFLAPFKPLLRVFALEKIPFTSEQRLHRLMTRLLRVFALEKIPFWFCLVKGEQLTARRGKFGEASGAFANRWIGREEGKQEK